MYIKNLLKSLTVEEKATIITGVASMTTKELPDYGIKSHQLADGPHGVRKEPVDRYTLFPSLCCIGASWDVDMIEKMGEALADECISGGISMLLAPGANIKRHILCGRNFEYISEDPVLTGNMAGAYINGLQSKGVAASLKHFAMNNQEKYREKVSVEADLRTIMEIYLKGFEIAIKKSNPVSVMCAYNKLYSIWCSENKFLLTDVLREKWGYEGFVISDWGAVHDICKSVMAGLDLQMPSNNNIVNQVQEGLENGKLKIENLDKAVERVLRFITSKPIDKKEIDRVKQHKIAQELAASGIVLLKNDNNVLPVTKEAYKKVAVIGEYAMHPLIKGQGSSEVYVSHKYIDAPIDELRNILSPEVNVSYFETYKNGEFSNKMMWPKCGEFVVNISDCDAVMFFVGAMVSEDTEFFDKRTVEINPNYELFIDTAINKGKKVVVVIQSGGAMILGDWHKKASAIVQMWLGGEGAGRAIAEVLTGIVNPSGKLSETFPSVMPKHLEYPGNGVNIHYNESLDVGYRYYDKHPNEVCYPFGHGLSYTSFDYSDLSVNQTSDKINVSVKITNTGDVFGGEVVQLYSSKLGGTVDTPVKELRAFKKVFLKPGTYEIVSFELDMKDIAHYNPILQDWVTEPCYYKFMVAASSADIRLGKKIHISVNPPYTIDGISESMIG